MNLIEILILWVAFSVLGIYVHINETGRMTALHLILLIISAPLVPFALALQALFKLIFSLSNLVVYEK